MELPTDKKVTSQLLESDNKEKYEIKGYKCRWTILLFYIYYSTVNAFQWIEYSSITAIAVKYYNVSSLTVDWTSIIYLALYPILVIPVSYIIDKKGLRIAGLCGCVGTALGTGIKVFSIRRDLFCIVLLGQSITSASQLFILCLPPKIAAVWFKANEVSTACSLGIFGTQLGTALGFVIPPIIVKTSENLEDIGNQLQTLCWGLTVCMIPISIAVLFYFPAEPPLPPSIAQAKERQNRIEVKMSVFFQNIKKLFQNKGFVIHMMAYGLNVGVYSAVGPFLSQFILTYFPGAHEDAGRMGFVLVIAGIVGSIIFGIILDKTHKYKEITFLLFFMTFVSIVVFMFTLELKSKSLLYLSCVILGISSNAYMPVGFEMATELTFPAEESTTTGILIAFTQILGVIFATCLGHLNILIGTFWSLGTQALLLGVGTVVTYFVPNDLRRQRVSNQNQRIKLSAENIFAALPMREQNILETKTGLM